MDSPRAPISLTPIERAVLVNQLEVRKALSGSDDFDESIEILRAGHEVLYDTVLADYLEPVAHADGKLVIEVLTMFRAFLGYVKECPDDVEMVTNTDLRFAGFDERTELGHLSFTRFLLYKQKKFPELLGIARQTDGAKSHVPMTGMYRRLLTLWNDVPEKGRLTRETIRRIFPANATAA